jgi:teichuronic acid biosynthesis glycosyltransferase TuaG
MNTSSSDLNFSTLVSVITPNYNGLRFIKRCVDSVSKQNVDFEHIVVDDCSTDGSWELLQNLASRNYRLKTYRLSSNSGPVIARNKAIELAQGRFLAFLDIDDFWLPQKLETQISFMDAHNSGLSFTDYRFVSEDGAKIGRRIAGFNKIGWHLHHCTRYLGCLTIVLDRKKFPEFRFPEINPAVRAEDFLGWSTCLRDSNIALRCPYDLARYSVVPKSRSSLSAAGLFSVWRLYHNIENIQFLQALFYFISFAFFASWKRYWNRPIFKSQNDDATPEWSILR